MNPSIRRRMRNEQTEPNRIGAHPPKGAVSGAPRPGAAAAQSAADAAQADATAALGYLTWDE